MRISICDDDIKQCESLQDMILMHGPHTITCFHSAEEMLFECESHFPFDCIFLDVQMKAMNGIDLAKQIRKIDSKVTIVFLSAIKDYVFEGYEVNALRYLLKPLQVDKCHELLEMIQKSIEKENAYILINKTKINCDDIAYIESYGHYCSIHTKGVIEVKKSLGEVLKDLPNTFIQTHRSYIVNLEHVESILKDKCLLDTDELIPISRGSLKKVNESFMEFIKGGIYE